MDQEIRLEEDYFNIYTQYDVVDGGRTEDGETFYFDCWYVVMTHESGRRWINLRSFKGYDINEVKREVEEYCAFVKERLITEGWSLRSGDGRSLRRALNRSSGPKPGAKKETDNVQRDSDGRCNSDRRVYGTTNRRTFDLHCRRIRRCCMYVQEWNQGKIQQAKRSK